MSERFSLSGSYISLQYRTILWASVLCVSLCTEGLTRCSCRDNAHFSHTHTDSVTLADRSCDMVWGHALILWDEYQSRMGAGGARMNL